MEAREIHEQIEEAAHEGRGSGRRVALLIAVLAALLAITELGAKRAQNEYMTLNVLVTDAWAFFQAKTIRLSVAEASLDTLQALRDVQPSAEGKAAIERRIAALEATARRLESDPASGEGRRELAARAASLDAARGERLAAYHAFEYGSAALQLAVVLASAGLLTGAGFLEAIAIGLGVLALVLNVVGYAFPALMHHLA